MTIAVPPAGRNPSRLHLSVAVLTLLAAASGPALADTSPATFDENGSHALTVKLGASHVANDPPASDGPPTGRRADLKDCDGEALLYGIGRAADPKEARFCAFVQRAVSSADQQSGLFDGNGLLMIIYANGMGVPRNRAVAVRLACVGVSGAEMEVDGWVPHLAGVVHSKLYSNVFSPCEDVESGYGLGVCAVHDARLADDARAKRIAKLSASLPEPARARFTDLVRAQTEWADNRGREETDQSGSDHIAVSTNETETQDDDFMAMLDRLRRRTPPPLGRAQLETAQARIDTELPKLLAVHTDPDQEGAVTPNGIKRAQAAWIGYRDAWGAFAKVAYPAWGADGAEAWVSMKRADMLGHLGAEMD